MHEKISDFWEWLETGDHLSSLPDKVETVAYHVCREATQERNITLFSELLDFFETYPEQCKHIEYDQAQAQQKGAERIVDAWSDFAELRALDDDTEQHLLKLLQAGDLESSSTQYHVASIAQTYFRTSEYEKCLTYFKLLEPTSDIDVCRNWADACKRLDKKEEALQPYARAIEILPNSPEWLCNYANCLIELGRTMDAGPYIDKAIRYGEEEKYRYSAHYVYALDLKAVYCREQKQYLAEYFQYARMLSGASERADALAMENGPYILGFVKP